MLCSSGKCSGLVSGNSTRYFYSVVGSPQSLPLQLLQGGHQASIHNASASSSAGHRNSPNVSVAAQIARLSANVLKVQMLQYKNDFLEFTTSQGISVYILCDDIISPNNAGMRNVEAIVSPCDKKLTCQDGLSYVIMKAAGFHVERQCRHRVKNGGILMVKDLFVTPNGSLQYKGNKLKNILHAVGPFPKELSYDMDVVGVLTRDTYCNCLKQANNDLTVSSIAMPLLGSGWSFVSIYGVP